MLMDYATPRQASAWLTSFVTDFGPCASIPCYRARAALPVELRTESLQRSSERSLSCYARSRGAVRVASLQTGSTCAGEATGGAGVAVGVDSGVAATTGAAVAAGVGCTTARPAAASRSAPGTPPSAP